MRFYDIALFLFVFNIALSVVTELNVFGYSVPSNDEWINKTYENVTNFATASKLESSDISFLTIGQNLLSGIGLAFKILAYSTILIEPRFESLGVPSRIAWLISMPIYLLYGIAIAQLLSGRAFKYNE